jgi:hypothetical protein
VARAEVGDVEDAAHAAGGSRTEANRDAHVLHFGIEQVGAVQVAAHPAERGRGRRRESEAPPPDVLANEPRDARRDVAAGLRAIDERAPVGRRV